MENRYLLRSRRVILLFLLLLGLFLRIHKLDQVPTRNETADEFAWTWSGMSLVQEGVPRAWTWLSIYNGGTTVEWNGSTYRIVTPYLDHPPLYSAFVGGWMTALGERELFQVSLKKMRASSILLYVLTFLSLAGWLRRESEVRLQLVSLLFFAVAPPAVINGKLVISENLLAPVTLLGCWLLSGAASGQRSRRHFLALGLVSAALPLIKLPALTLSGAFLWLAVARRDSRAAVTVFVGTLVGLFAVLCYAAYFDLGLFVNMLFAQERRFTGFHGIGQLLFDHKLVITSFFYVPFVIGLIAVFAGLEKRLEVPIVVIVYVAGLTFLVSEKEVFGWYSIPLYPFLCIGAATFVIKAMDERNIVLFLVWAALSLSGIVLALSGQATSLLLLRWGYLAAFLGVLAIAAWRFGRGENGQRWSMAALLLLQASADVFFILTR